VSLSPLERRIARALAAIERIEQQSDTRLPTQFYDEQGQLLYETPAARRSLLPAKVYINLPEDDGIEL